jgi:hypothetical protein
MNMKSEISQDDVDYALRPSPWDLGNKALYSLCEDHPKHDSNEAIIAKVWLIGRAYAAAIERRREAEDLSDDFYESIVAPRIKESRIDQWLASLPPQLTDSWHELGQVITIHKRLTDLFYEMTRLQKRSLASKYLHFHRRNLFFIYDNRAKTAISKVTPSIKQIREIPCENRDQEYYQFVRRCQWLTDHIAQQHGETLTPRQVDKILLNIAYKTKKSSE